MSSRRGYDPGWRASIAVSIAAVNAAATIGAGIPDGPKLHQIALMVLCSVLTPAVVALSASESFKKL
jgi:hypothetical protein